MTSYSENTTASWMQIEGIIHGPNKLQTNYSHPSTLYRRHDFVFTCQELYTATIASSFLRLFHPSSFPSRLSMLPFFVHHLIGKVYRAIFSFIASQPNSKLTVLYCLHPFFLLYHMGKSVGGTDSRT